MNKFDLFSNFIKFINIVLLDNCIKIDIQSVNIEFFFNVQTFDLIELFNKCLRFILYFQHDFNKVFIKFIFQFLVSLHCRKSSK